jgi:hypothetical protein
MANNSQQLELFPIEMPDSKNDTELSVSGEIKETEWCFQFFDNEPVVFGWSDVNDSGGPLVIKLQPNTNELLTFKQNGMEFKLFPREMTETTYQKRAEANENKYKKD